MKLKLYKEYDYIKSQVVFSMVLYFSTHLQVL
jgi:hypothetical protein